jgi:imidazolonepropionase-like amidohydrolase
MPSLDGHHQHGQHAGQAAGPNVSHGSSAIKPASNVLRDNLELLQRAGVTVLIGSDHAETSLAEVLHLRTLHLFDNRTLLKMWCEATPAAIFPGRHIAKFAEGYEASFLALGGNPIEDFEQVRAIRRRFKQGVNRSMRSSVMTGRCLVGSVTGSSLIRRRANHRCVNI